MILFLYGDDSFSRQERLNALKAGFIKKYDAKGLNIETLEGENLSLEDFHKAIATGGMFSNKRLIIIKNIFSQKNEKISDAIAEKLPSASKDNIIIFTENDFKKINAVKLAKKLLLADKVEHFPILKSGQIYTWILNSAKKKKATIDSEAVNYLIEAIGSDLWRMNNELNKLANYTKHITIKDTDLFIDSPIDDNIFNFMDAISAKDTKKALKLLHDQLNAGANEFMLLSMLARQIKILLQVKETGGKELALHPFVIKKALAQIGKFSLSKLKSLFARIADIDNKLKSSQGSPALLLDLFVIEMCEEKGN